MASNKTVAKIVREMQKCAAECTSHGCADMERFADEIEGLHKRELAAKDAEIERLRLRLKVAEDAIQDAIEEYCRKCNVSADDRREVCDQCHVCDWKEALAAIKEGGAK